MFGLAAVAAVVCVLALARLPEPDRPGSSGFLATLGQALRERWVLVVVGLAFVEGAVVLGLLTLLAPALQDQGLDASIAGLAVAGYGLSTLLSTRLVRPLARRLSVPSLMAIGGSAMVLGFSAVAVDVSVPTVVFSALMLGVTWALLHTSLQAWATTVVPGARGTVVALFAASRFAGSSVGTLAAGPAAEAGQWEGLFGLTAAVALVLTVVAVAARRAYGRTFPASH